MTHDAQTLGDGYWLDGKMTETQVSGIVTWAKAWMAEHPNVKAQLLLSLYLVDLMRKLQWALPGVRITPTDKCRPAAVLYMREDDGAIT